VRIRVCRLEEVPEGQCQIIRQNRDDIALIHRNGTLHAINDTCPHLGGSLGTGWLTDEGTVVCPLHGWEFRLADGEGVWPQGLRIDTYPVVVEDGEVYVVLHGGGARDADV
jgi:nitrite reductase/ring-hydroxylating ferredoxin subunit